MVIKLKVPKELARDAIQEHVEDLNKQEKLIFKGSVKKTIASTEFILNKVSSIRIQLPEEHCPLDEVFVFLGLAQLSFVTDEPNPDHFSDSKNYLISGQVSLQDQQGYIYVSLIKNEVIITDNIL